MEAVYDDVVKLSYHALIGTCKQSVSDVVQIYIAVPQLYLAVTLLKLIIHR